ncbi:amino acid adenylation domain-containing protein [Streptomyces bohaiensis]|uniref:amino acid adenylation domain-containing protein n=1 Tax=Streptomyces bohaiensis TaxID=1431344 RepID=UPI003B774133
MESADGGYPLSHAQEQLWLLDQLRQGGATEYLMHETFRIVGPLDDRALSAALTEIAARHEVLRTRYGTEGGSPVQLIDDPVPVVPDRADLGDLPRAEREDRLRQLVEERSRRPLDLRAEHPWRAALVRLAPGEHALLLTFHHIAFDGWSWGIVADELRALYEAFRTGGPDPLEPLELQYADYAEWRREWLAAQPEVTDRQLDHWRQRLAGLEPLDLPTDRPRPATWQPDGDIVRFTVPAPLASRVRELAQERGATLFMTYLTAYQLLLARYGGCADVAVGVSFARRDDVRLEKLLGIFLDTVVIRGDLGGHRTFPELLDGVKDATLDAYGNQDVAFSQVVAALDPPRDPGRNPLFQAGFALHNAHRSPFSLPGLTVTREEPTTRSSAFDLSLHLAERADGTMTGELLFPVALFDRDRIERMAANLLQLLEGVTDHPGRPVAELDLLAPTERATVLGWGEGPLAPTGDDRPLVRMVLDRAAATPDAVAVAHDDGDVTYARLAHRAAELATALVDAGVRAADPVAVSLRRGPDLVASILAVLGTGAQLVPLATDLPPARRNALLADSAAGVVLTAEEFRDRFAESARVLTVDTLPTTPNGAGHLPPAGFPYRADPDDAACLIYTSGSTGTPKGVVVRHGGLRNRVLWSVDRYAMTPADRLLQKTTIGFDAAMWEFLSPLVSGGTVVAAPDDAHRDPAVMAAAVARHRVTLLQVVPSVLRLLVEEPALAGCCTLRLVSSAGEPLPASLCEGLRAVLPQVEVHNTYGPTECSIDSTHQAYRPGDPAAGVVPIGRPLPGAGVSVVDAADRLVPVGVPGELCVRGVGLARGYHGRAAQTAERFTPDPYATTPGGRWYRTGDLVRWRADGTLEFLGRTDDQVKVHGVRIEPAEIEALLTAHPAVAAAAVTATRDAHGDTALTAFVVPAAPDDELAATLLDHLADRLPAPVVPGRLLLLEQMPLTASGKTDRRALPDPDRAAAGGAAASADGAAPSDPTEAAIAATMAEVLGVPVTDTRADFFALGGHSLLAIRLALRLRRTFGVELTVAELFNDRTVAGLADRVRRAAAPVDTVRPEPREGGLPLSHGQQRLWFLEQLDPGGSEYLIPLALRLRGPLDTDALRGALEDVARVHEVLRTRYTDRDGTPLQHVDPPGSVPFHLADLTAGPGGTGDGPAVPERLRADRARELVEQALRVPFDLSREHPLRATVVRAAPDDHWLALTSHHIAFDAWSTKIFLRDLDRAYRLRTGGEGAPLGAPAVGYADYAAWQRRQEDTAATADRLAYWRDRLADLVPVELPTDRPRPALRDPSGDTVVVDLPAETAAAVSRLAARHGATPFMTLLTAFQVLLHRYTGRADIAVGTPVAGRTREETEELLGVFVNNLVIRTDLAGSPAFADLMGQVRERTLEAFAHQEVPFERVVEEVAPGRDLSRSPLFEVMFEHQHMGGIAGSLGDLAVEPLRAGEGVAKYDLTLTVKERPDGRMHCWFEYATALFDRETVERLATHYLRVLESAVAGPDTAVGELRLIPDAELRRLTAEWPDPLDPAVPGVAADGTPDATVPELFARRAAATPDAVALLHSGPAMSYGELERRSRRLAHRLRELGAGPETVVASCQPRSVDTVVTLLGVLRAGAAYLPLDPAHPPRRLAGILADAEVPLVVTTAAHRDTATAAADGRTVVTVDELPEPPPGTDAAALPPPDPEALAYVIYTSGSTGRPKGVMIDHRAYAHHCLTAAHLYGIAPGERVGQLSAPTFDVAMEQIAAPLVVGATVVVADPLFWTPEELPGKLAEHRVTVLETTPAYYREVMAHDTSALTDLRLINLSSEVVTVSDARRWEETGLPGRFIACYGPTEASVSSVLHTELGDLATQRGTASLPLGHAFPGTRAYVLDARQRPVPTGVPGELCLGGVRLARGYHGRPDLTADRFVPDPFGPAGGRLYRTGDLVRHRPDGVLEFLGRIDQQVKIRGLRIELGEIEAALTEHPGVSAAAVVARESAAGGADLAAYVVGEDGPAPEPAALREHLRERLPDYMVPALWTALPALPMTSSQKIDRRALPEPEIGTPRPYTPPRDPAEEAVATVWAETLGLERVGADDDFFLLGGHSLLATRVLARLRETFALDLPLRLLFEATTVATLAAAVTAAVEAEIAQLSDDEVTRLLNREGAR